MESVWERPLRWRLAPPFPAAAGDGHREEKRERSKERERRRTRIETGRERPRRICLCRVPPFIVGVQAEGRRENEEDEERGGRVCRVL